MVLQARGRGEKVGQNRGRERSSTYRLKSPPSSRVGLLWSARFSFLKSKRKRSPDIASEIIRQDVGNFSDYTTLGETPQNAPMVPLHKHTRTLFSERLLWNGYLCRGGGETQPTDHKLAGRINGRKGAFPPSLV